GQEQISEERHANSNQAKGFAESASVFDEQATIINKQAIVFDQTSFSYSIDRPILHHLSFKAEPGQVTAFVGPSGTGKTTIFSLIERFYKPTAGRILYGACPIEELTLFEWRGKIAYVSQDSPMMAG